MARHASQVLHSWWVVLKHTLGSGIRPGYTAFLSYRHVAQSRQVAISLESGLKRYALSWFRYPRRIFRDEQILRPGDDLPAIIGQALEDSDYLLYLASEEAAKSKWVEDELRIWCDELKRQDRLVLIHVDGTIHFTEDKRGIDWEKSSALPSSLNNHVKGVPLFVDLTWLKTVEDGDMANIRFKSAVNGLVARFEDTTPETLSGEEIRIYRRNRLLRNAALLVISTLALAASTLAVVADHQRREAVRESQANELATRALQLEPSDSTRAFHLLADAYRKKPTVTIRKLIFDRYAKDSLYTRQYPMPGYGVGESAWEADGNIAIANGPKADIWLADGTRRSLDPKGEAVLNAQFYHRGESLELMTSTFSGLVAGWAVSTGEKLWEHKLKDQFNDVKISSDGRHLLILTLNGGDQLWKLPEFKMVYALNRGGPSANTAAFAPDGSLIAISRDKIANVYQRQEGALVKSYDSSNEEITDLTFSADSAHLFGGSRDETAYLWKIGSETEDYERFQGQYSPLSKVAVSPKGDRYATGSDDGRIVLWNEWGEPQRDIQAHRDGVKGLTFSPDGRFLISGGGADSVARVWTVYSLDEPTRRIDLDASELSSVAFSPDGTGLVAVSKHGNPYIVDVPTGRILSIVPSENTQKAIYLPGSDRTLLILAREEIFIWKEGAAAPSVRIPGEFIDCAYLAPSPACGDAGPGIITIRQAYSVPSTVHIRGMNGALVREGLTLDFTPTCLGSSPGGEWIAVGAEDGVTRVYNRQLKEIIQLRKHSSFVACLEFSLDGRYLATGSYDETARVWEIPSGKLLANLEGGHSSYISAISFSPDGSQLLTAGFEIPGIAILWNWRNGYFEKILRGHGHRLTSGGFSPTGREVVTGDLTGVLRLWSPQPTLNQFLTESILPDHQEWVPASSR